MKFIEKPMIALAIIFVAMLLLPNYKAAFGYGVSGTEGFITCPKQAPIKIKEWGYSINEGIDLQPNRVGWLTILVPDVPGTTRETNGWITDGRIQGSPGGPHDFVLEGRVVEEGICQPEGPSTATFTIQGYCDGSKATFITTDGEVGTFRNLHPEFIPNPVIELICGPPWS